MKNSWMVQSSSSEDGTLSPGSWLAFLIFYPLILSSVPNLRAFLVMVDIPVCQKSKYLASSASVIES